MDKRIFVMMTETMGRGVFAAKLIKAGEFLDDIFYTIEVPAPERQRLKGATPSRFWFENDDDGTALIALGYVSLMNPQRNAQFPVLLGGDRRGPYRAAARAARPRTRRATVLRLPVRCRRRSSGMGEAGSA